MTLPRTPLLRLAGIFPDRAVFAKCEFLGASGCFKIRGALHLLAGLKQEGGPRKLVVPSMGNTALGAAVGARDHGFEMVGVVPESITRAKDEKLQALGVRLRKIAGGGAELLHQAVDIAKAEQGYFVHPHLDPRWTDGYQAITAEVLEELPDCRTIVIPVGGGGLLMGLSEHLRKQSSPVRLIGCEPYNFPKYAAFNHPRSATCADGLLLETPHPAVQKRIRELAMDIQLVREQAIVESLRDLFDRQALIVEPSSAINVALVKSLPPGLEPIVVVLTGGNIAREDFDRLLAMRPAPA